MNRPRSTSSRRRSAAGRAQPPARPADPIEPILENARAYAESYTPEQVPRGPARRVAVVTCMDARIDPARLLGLAPGDAHVLRNAGGVVTEDVIRSLAVSQHILATEAVMVILHTECGMLELGAGSLERALEERTGVRPTWSAEGFRDIDAEVRQSLARLAASPFVSAEYARGFVYDTATATLREVV